MSTPSSILSTAYDLFTRRGYHGTSMRAIAKDAGIALGGIYNHFQSKEDIFREVILAYHPYHEILPAIAAAEYDTLEGLFREAAALIDSALSERPELLNLMFIELVEFDSRHVPELLERILPQVQQTLARFDLSGERLRPIPVPMVWRVFIGTILGYFLSKQALGPTIPPEFREHALDRFVDVFLRGILEPEHK
ncbi:MAG TPA: TetR/AcrR family transcriptional regulator [Anaerolineales bacterium]|nr:TetR/AcrR family transcriptional regulator [Anaerolineales bacterium]